MTVKLPGHEPFQRVIAMERDQAQDLLVELPPTPQRIAAWAALATGAAGAVAGGVLTGLALSQEAAAVDLRALQETRPLLPEERERYNGAVMARDDLALAAAISGGAAALTAAVGIGLFITDRPEPPPGPGRESPAAPPPRAELTIGLLSAGLRGKF